MTDRVSTTSTYVEPLDRDQSALTVLAVAVPATDRASLADALDRRARPAELIEADTAGAAVDRVAEGGVDCVVSGTDLPDSTVLELLATARDERDGLPVVVYAAAGTDTTPTDAINAGADGYFRAGGAPEAFDRLAERIETVGEDWRSRVALAESNRLLLHLTEYTSDTLWMFTADWADTAVVNSAYEDVWDRSQDDLIDDPGDFLEGVHPADVDTVTAGMERVSSGEPVDLEYRVTMDDETRWVSVHAEPVVGDSGDIEYVAGFTRDVDDLKQRELSMGSLNEALRDLLAARDDKSVAANVVDVAESVIGCPVTVVRGRRGDAGSLAPLAATAAALDRVGAEDSSELPVVTAGDRLYEIVERGESRVVEDGDALAETTPVCDVGSLLVVPLGDHGSLTVGTAPGERLSAYERDLLEVLSRTATAALNRVRRDEELEAYRTELEQSNEDLEQFAYVASHDLQEPLRMVSSYVSLLDDEYGGELDAEADEYLDYAVDGADRMREMIDALLDYARVHTHAEDPEPIDASAVLDDALAELALLIDDHGATVERGELPTVVADPDQLRQVFQNLVKNSVEHGGPGDDADGAQIAIEATERNDCWEFSVADDGPGVPVDQQDDVFDIFRTAGSGDGTGIGLAVCKRIVERHGGDIWVDSQPGDGTAFRFTLPAAPGGAGEGQR